MINNVSTTSICEFSVKPFRSPVMGQLVVNSLLSVTLKGPDDFGVYSCTVRNVSSDFCLHNSGRPNVMHAAFMPGLASRCFQF